MNLPEQNLDRLGLCYAGYENIVNITRSDAEMNRRRVSNKSQIYI
jgi:hypothetical protein